MKKICKCILGMGFLLILTVPASQAQIDESLVTWKPESGISLNGTTDYAIVESSEDFDVFEITIDAWVRFRSLTEEDQQQIIGRGGAGNYFTFYADRGNIRFLVENIEAEAHESARGPLPPVGQWVHMTCTYDEEFVRLYYNGVLIQETEWVGTMAAGEEPLMIGALEEGLRHFNGLVENLRIWNRALSEEEIVTLLQTEPVDENIDDMMDNGLIAYWSERGFQDDTIEDLANGHNANLQQFSIDESNLTFKPDAGIAFDGKATYIEVEDGTPFNFEEFTLETWVKFDRTHQNQVFMNRGGAPDDFTFYLYENIRFLVVDGTDGYSHANAFVPPANTWVHVVGTQSADGKRLYYNGNLVAEELDIPIAPVESENPLLLGALEPGLRHLDGEMENLRIWNRALSEDEIHDLLATSPEDEDIDAMKDNGLIAYWALRSIDGEIVTDLTENGHDGVFHQFEVSEDLLSFKPETGILFDGESNYAMVDDPTLFEINQTTVEAWVNLTPIFHTIDLGYRGIVGRGGDDEYFSLYATNQYGNRIHMEIQEYGDSAAPMPPAGQWVHLCGTYDETTLKLYYNGVLADDVDAPGFIQWGDTPFFVGALSESGGLFEGQMDYIRVWDRALSEEEIQELLATPPAEEDVDEMRQNGLLLYYSSDSISENVLADISGNGNDAVWNGPVVVSVQEWSLY